MGSRRIVWLVPERAGGIRSYADELWPAVKKACSTAGWECVRVDCERLVSRAAVEFALRAVKEKAPDLIHVQHEYGLFGSKFWPFYRFLQLAEGLSEIAPCVATMHSVIPESYELPWRARGWQSLPRFLFNLTFLRAARPGWREGTWGRLRGLIVHSGRQLAEIKKSSSILAKEIPHYVPSHPASFQPNARDVVVFGFFSPEKGQDIVLKAWAKLGLKDRSLILAGGVRRPEDQPYLDYCRSLIAGAQLANIEITGFVPPSQIDGIYARAALVIAPFRETSGSGSIVNALSRGMPILASDLSLNLELTERVAGCLTFFKSEDAGSCAIELNQLLEDLPRRSRLAEGALRYANKHSLEKVAEAHRLFYEEAAPL